MVLGVTGGIAAYKSVQLARDLTRLGARVDVVLSRGAREFVRPLTFEGVTGRPVATELFSAEGAALHIRLGREADVVCVAPATADFLARAARGGADDLLTTTLLATRAPVVLCPAMNDRMYAHPQVQANLAHLAGELGYRVVGPAVGPLAHGEGEGPGRMVEPGEIVQHVGRALAPAGPLRGRRVLLTAGPTREAIDAVRYVGNRSSGRMGYALAQAAWLRGGEVVLVSGPTALPAPVGVRLEAVETALEMKEAVEAHLAWADVLVFAAAVADFRPGTSQTGKLKRSEAPDGLTVPLVPNPDVAAETRGRRQQGAVTVGFALETRDLLANARGKMEAKGFDLLVANEAGRPDSGFESPTNQVVLLRPGSEPEPLPLLAKEAVAEEVLDRVEMVLGTR